MMGRERHNVIWPDFHKSIIFRGLPPKKEDMKTIRYYQRMNGMKKKTLAQRIMNKLRGGVK